MQEDMIKKGTEAASFKATANKLSKIAKYHRCLLSFTYLLVNTEVELPRKVF